MHNPHTHAILKLPEFQALLRQRHALTWPLLWLMIGAYFSFVLLIAFNKEALGQPVGESVISVGIVVGLGLIFLTFAVTVIYVRRANRIFQPLIDAIAKHVEELPHA